MRFLIINTDYAGFIDWLYTQHPNLESQPYAEQMRARNESLFGVADFYSSNLRKLGHEAWDVHSNNVFIQKAWAREQGIRVEKPLRVITRGYRALQSIKSLAARTAMRRLKPLAQPFLNSLDVSPSWFYQILIAQIKYYKPEVILVQNIAVINTRFLRQVKPLTRLVMGQHAATRLTENDYGCYDLIVSSFPPTIDFFRQRGICAEFNRLGFEPNVLSYLRGDEKTFDLTFVGSLGGVHASRIALLEALCSRFPQLRIWAPTLEQIDSNSPIRPSYSGSVWGLEMYKVLRASKITLNHHGDIAPYASNQRLFEATGVGALLFTEWMPDLNKMFEPNQEVVTYRNAEDCAQLIQHYLDNAAERERIAHAGQKRTLREHTYFQRMQELVEIVQEYL